MVEGAGAGVCGTDAEIAGGYLRGLMAQVGELGVELVSFEPVDDPRTAREEEVADGTLGSGFPMARPAGNYNRRFRCESTVGAGGEKPHSARASINRVVTRLPNQSNANNA